MYTEQVMDHFAHPRNVGEIENSDGCATAGDAGCGNVVRISIEVQKGIITDARFKTFGCGAAIAVSSRMTEMVMGKTVDEALEISNKQLSDSLGGLPPARMHCCQLVLDALHAAVADYKKKRTAGEISR